jgi:hypothetical protein
MTTEEGDIIIAEFDGFKFYNDDPQVYPNGYFYSDEKLEDDFYEIEDFEYHSSWDLLMPVVKKIKSIHTNPCLLKEAQLNGKINFALIEININKTWLAVIEFIQWYNQTKKS